MYSELLSLCGFERDEIERERPRIDRAYEILGIGEDDIKTAEERVKTFFSVELPSIRKVLGIWMKQLIDIVLTKEEGKKVIYTSFPCENRIGAAFNLAGVYCQPPEIVFGMALGQIFGKLVPILEVAEQNGMPPGLGMCSFNSTRLGAIASGMAPKPDLTITSGFFCDQTAKTDDFLHEVYGVPNVFIDNCMDSSWDVYPTIPENRLKYFAGEMKDAFSEAQDILDVKISDETFHQARVEAAKLWLGMGRVFELMRAEPQPISQVDLNLFYWMIGTPESRIIAEGTEAIKLLAKDIKQRIDKGIGVVEKGAPRVVFFSPSIADPALGKMFEETGLSIASSAFFWLSPSEMVKSKYSTFEEKSVESQMKKGVYHSSAGLVARFREAAEAWNADGVFYYFHFSCRPLCISSTIMKKDIEKKVGIPVLALEGDFFDSRDYSVQALRTRVETFAELLRANKKAA
ncbi:MAG: 2-hydroxyacyl-CoA dehydratase family protein [Thermodesulfobacteriota bacterium]|nr:2-hydroxyacyl-CoA dehydratase family protein [Thermodesulfobacteriota bacterium]